MPEQIIEAEFTFTGDGFEPGIQVAVDDGGRIAATGRLGKEPTRRLTGQALLPGMVNAHSHAFQIGLRGRAESYPKREGDFWSQREELYGLAARLGRDEFHRLCLRAFREMRSAGITSVGEFHYFHHSRQGSDFALDDRILAAASEAGIRMVLLQAHYTSGGIGKPLAGAQERFGTENLDTYWKQIDRLAPRLDSRLQGFGVAAHSLRAVSLEDLIELHAEARKRDMVFHIHVEEPRAEIDDCIAAYGAPPIKLLNNRLEISSSFTAVHCTQTDGDDLEKFVAAGGNVCICPLTEANLGDGIADIPRIHAGGGRISLGTDGNVRISLLEELRWLEYAQRLARRRRGILRNPAGSVALPLFQAATINGARSLGLETGAVQPGLWADLIAVDLTHPLLEAAPPETLLESLLFGSSEAVITATCVGGKWEGG